MNRRSWLSAISFVCVLLLTMNAHAQQSDGTNEKSPSNAPTPDGADKKSETITLGAGCFWCVEAVFQRVKGVSKVVSGYAGGETENPTYEQVCTGKTGHAEVIQVTFDPDVVSLEQILIIFWKTHDPTTLNQQGPDYGTQYRSAVFYDSDKQRETAEAIKKRLTEEKAYVKKIVTEITPMGAFYAAEGYHQNYFNLNKNQPYCRTVVASKVSKFEKLFKEYSVNNKKKD